MKRSNKKEGARVLKSLKVIFKTLKTAYSVVSGGIPTKFDHFQAFIIVLVTCNNEEDPIKNDGTRVLTRFPNYKSVSFFFKR